MRILAVVIFIMSSGFFLRGQMHPDNKLAGLGAGLLAVVSGILTIVQLFETARSINGKIWLMMVIMACGVACGALVFRRLKPFPLGPRDTAHDELLFRVMLAVIPGLLLTAALLLLVVLIEWLAA